MSLNSVKKVALAASLLAAVACGKNKNNLNIDGTYEIEKSSFTDANSKEQINESIKPNAVEIKDNVMTIYGFSDDKKAVDVTTVKLDVKGKRLSSITTVGDSCSDSEETASQKLTGDLAKTSDRLTITSNSTDGKSELVLKKLSSEKFAELTKDLKAGKLEKACIVNGKVQAKLGKIQSDDAIAQAVGQSLEVGADSLAQVSENKGEIPKNENKMLETAISSDVESAAQTVSSTKDDSAMDEASLKSQTNGSAEKEESDLVSEQK